MKEINAYLDHTNLKPEATEADIVQLCQEAKAYAFYGVCVNSGYVPLAKKQLQGTEIRVVSVVGFPLGACATEVKAFETKWACQAGADEIDMVISVGAVKEQRWDYVRQDIREVVAAAKQYGSAVKVILETCLLTEQEIIEACHVAEEAGAAWVKTSTGFSVAGATTQQVSLMRNSVSEKVGVKAAGGIRTGAAVKAMIRAGADRIGVSASVEIMKE